METYRSGHNEAHSKCVSPPGLEGSNPSVSAKIDDVTPIFWTVRYNKWGQLQKEHRQKSVLFLCCVKLNRIRAREGSRRRRLSSMSSRLVFPQKSLELSLKSPLRATGRATNAKSRSSCRSIAAGERQVARHREVEFRIYGITAPEIRYQSSLSMSLWYFSFSAYMYLSARSI